MSALGIVSFVWALIFAVMVFAGIITAASRRDTGEEWTLRDRRFLWFFFLGAIALSVLGAVTV